MRNHGYFLSHIRKILNIKSDFQIIRWITKYNQIRNSAFDIDFKSNTSGPGQSSPKTKFSSLKEKIKYLRMKNEYLKKLQALQKKNQNIK